MPPLPHGKKETEMVGGLMDVAPLVRGRVSKQVALEQMISVSLMHFAAHGNAERVQTVLTFQTLFLNGKPIC